MIGMSQNWGFYLLIFGVLPLLFASRSYIWGRGGYAFLNRTNVEVMKGLSMIWIIIQSLSHQLANQTLVSIHLSKSEVLAASLFLFCCGFEVMMEYRGRRRYLKKVIVHQIIRIFLMYLLCHVIGTVIYIYKGGHDDFFSMIKNALVFRFSDGSRTWLIGTLLYFYMVFYISFQSKYKMNLLAWFSVGYIGISFILKWNASLAFCFLIGVFTAQYKKYLFKFIRQKFVPLFFIALFTFSSSYLLYLKGALFVLSVLPYLFLLLMCCVLMKLQCRSHFFKMMGSNAVEFYLIHQLLLLVFFSGVKREEGIFLILFFVLTVIGALFLKNISHQILFIPKSSAHLK